MRAAVGRWNSNRFTDTDVDKHPWRRRFASRGFLQQVPPIGLDCVVFLFGDSPSLFKSRVAWRAKRHLSQGHFLAIALRFISASADGYEWSLSAHRQGRRAMDCS